MLKSIIISLAISIALTILIFVVLSFILSLTDSPSSYIKICVNVAAVFCILTAGFITAKNWSGSISAGFFAGVLSGLFYIILILSASILITGKLGVFAATPVFIITGLLAGGTGGMLGMKLPGIIRGK